MGRHWREVEGDKLRNSMCAFQCHPNVGIVRQTDRTMHDLCAGSCDVVILTHRSSRSYSLISNSTFQPTTGTQKSMISFSLGMQKQPIRHNRSYMCSLTRLSKLVVDLEYNYSSEPSTNSIRDKRLTVGRFQTVGILLVRGDGFAVITACRHMER